MKLIIISNRLPIKAFKKNGKVIFIPSFSVIKRIAIKLFIDLLRYKFGLGNLESKLDAKLATYEKGE